MHYVYAIQSQIDGRVYVGMSEDSTRRLVEHNSGHTRSTKAYIPWKIVYTKCCADRISARKEEKRLKSGYGKEFLKKYIIDTFAPR